MSLSTRATPTTVRTYNFQYWYYCTSECAAWRAREHVKLLVLKLGRVVARVLVVWLAAAAAQCVSTLCLSHDPLCISHPSPLWLSPRRVRSLLARAVSPAVCLDPEQCCMTYCSQQQPWTTGMWNPRLLGDSELQSH